MVAIIIPPLAPVLIETFRTGTPFVQGIKMAKREDSTDSAWSVLMLACVWRSLLPKSASLGRIGPTITMTINFVPVLLRSSLLPLSILMLL